MRLPAAMLAALLAAPLLAGCALPGREAPPASVHVGLPDVLAGDFAECASPAAQPLAVPLRIDSFRETTGLAPGIHRTGNATLTWVWVSYHDTPRDDRVTRVNEVQAFREADGRAVLCTRVELATPADTDGTRRTYDVGAHIASTAGPLPGGDLRVVVNWIMGCSCPSAPLRGNTTTLVPQAP